MPTKIDADLTLTRKDARALLDVLMESTLSGAAFDALIDKLDNAQAAAGDDGRETIVVEILGGEI